MVGYLIWVLKFVVAVLLVPQMNGELVSIPDIVQIVVSMIPMKIEIYLALHDKRHAVAVAGGVVVAVAVDVAAVVLNQSMIHFHQMLHSLRFEANRTFAIHDYTSIRLYSFLTKLHQTRTHNIASNHLDADNIQILPDTQMCQTWQNLLDLHPTIVLLSTVVETVPLLDALQKQRKTKQD